MNRSQHDVIIVGASIAGCRAARTLADSGARVLLLDRSEFPRWKPCAGGLTLKARPYLSGSLWERVETTMTGAYFTWGEDYLTHLRARGPLGWMVHRESFDEAHLKLATSGPGGGHPPLTAEAWFDFRIFPHGYGWIFPKSDHYSVGGFVYGRTAPRWMAIPR